ncbi:MAG: phosphoadenosine phosphosulfate reductase family protein [Candidatus Hodarchaeota archaeon]
MPKTFLGPLLLNWCKCCNLPILEAKRCDLCGSPTTKVKINPPGDVRPAFKADLNRLRDVIERKYGRGIGLKMLPKDKIILLNKVSALERSDEVVVDGQVVGNLFFDPRHMAWGFAPKLVGGRILFHYGGKKWVRVDAGAVNSIVNGANILAPGVIDFDPSIAKDDYVVVLSEDRKVIAVGRAKVDGEVIPSLKRGMVVKSKGSGSPCDPEILPGGQSWEDVTEANKAIVERRARSARQFIGSVAKEYKLPIAVAYSGGKDSLCTLLLVSEVLNTDFNIFFIDTGIEFPETIEYVYDSIRKLGLIGRFVVKNSGKSFWEELHRFGPPARDYRFCCKILKLSNVAELIDEEFNGKVLTFVGQRRYESITRSREKKIWTNSYIPNQINATPIKNWTSLHVWLYIYGKRAPLNPLYFKGYERIGCVYCPAAKLSDFENLKKVHPNLYSKWMDFLISWSRRHGLSDEWAIRGFWRWKKLTGERLRMAREIGIKLHPVDSGTYNNIAFDFTYGFSPCSDGSYSLEGRFGCALDLEKVANRLILFGGVSYSRAFGVVSTSEDGVSANIFADGSVRILLNNRDEKNLGNAVQRIIRLVIQSVMCSGCGICVQQCPNKSIEIAEGFPRIDEEKCNRCKSCLERCPVLSYGLAERLTKSIPERITDFSLERSPKNI